MLLRSTGEYRWLLRGGAVTFVQNQDFCFAQQSPGKTYELPLPSGKRRAAFLDWRIKPLREAFHVLLQVGLFYPMISVTIVMQRWRSPYLLEHLPDVSILVFT